MLKLRLRTPGRGSWGRIERRHRDKPLNRVGIGVACTPTRSLVEADRHRRARSTAINARVPHGASLRQDGSIQSESPPGVMILPPDRANLTEPELNVTNLVVVDTDERYPQPLARPVERTGALNESLNRPDWFPTHPRPPATMPGRPPNGPNRGSKGHRAGRGAPPVPTGAGHPRRVVRWTPLGPPTTLTSGPLRRLAPPAYSKSPAVNPPETIQTATPMAISPTGDSPGRANTVGRASCCRARKRWRTP